jgi:hypothetical protein
MSAKIEINKNTLLKLLIRRGTNVDRQNVILTEGELGYTIDTKRLFVGDGQTQGGISIGSTYAGSSTAVTDFVGAVVGDYAFDTDNNKLYVHHLSGSASNINNWVEVGGVYTAADSTVVVSNTNGIRVGTLSAGNISSNLLGNSISLDGTNKISLSSSIKTDRITPLNSTYLSLPQNLSINSVNYSWPTGGVGSDLYLTSDISGNLSWSNAATPTTVFVAGTAGQIAVGSIMPYVSSANAPAGWLLCNGQSVVGASYPELSAVVGYSFGGSGANFNVPNLINKTIYGVSNSPSSSTLVSVSSGTNSTLSATGMLYIIKAKPDYVVSSTFTINNGLTGTVNGVDVTGSAIGTLSGNIKVGLPAIITGQTIVGGSSFTVDTYGRVTTVASTSSIAYPAGTITQVTGTDIYNENSPIAFLKRPVTIYYELQSSNTTSVTTTISAYPKITSFTAAGGRTQTLYNVSPAAKNLIVDCEIRKSGPDGGNMDRFVVSAPNASLLTGTTSPDTYEYLVGSSRASGSGDNLRSGSQVFIPLSAAANGNLTCAFRISPSKNDTITIRIVGYTI